MEIVLSLGAFCRRLRAIGFRGAVTDEARFRDSGALSRRGLGRESRSERGIELQKTENLLCGEEQKRQIPLPPPALEALERGPHAGSE